MRRTMQLHPAASDLRGIHHPDMGDAVWGAVRAGWTVSACDALSDPLIRGTLATHPDHPPVHLARVETHYEWVA